MLVLQKLSAVKFPNFQQSLREVATRLLPLIVSEVHMDINDSAENTVFQVLDALVEDSPGMYVVQRREGTLRFRKHSTICAVHVRHDFSLSSCKVRSVVFQYACTCVCCVSVRILSGVTLRQN